MGKKRIVTKPGGESNVESQKRSMSKLAKRKLSTGTLHIQSTYNNTKILLTDPSGNALAWSSSGSLGFKGAKKGTPYAASKASSTTNSPRPRLIKRAWDAIVLNSTAPKRLWV